MIDDQYSEAAAALGARYQPEELAEWHGTVTGILCAAAQDTVDQRLAELGPPGGGEGVDDGGAVPSDRVDGIDDEDDETSGVIVRPRQPLVAADAQRVIAVTDRALGQEELAFQPLLLEDASLTERALALGAWCQGFLVGLATTLPDATSRLAGEAREALDDFGELARAVRGSEDAEEVETAYAELVEFVRVATLLVYEELRPVRAGATVAATPAGDSAGSDDDESA